jgi:hypothetical protein
MMAADSLSVLATVSDSAEALRRFIGRIRAWQEFMQRGSDGILGPEEEVGLLGELVLLERMLTAGLPPLVAIRAWHGPVRGTHDFVLGPGAVEVKSTIATGTFPATISSLEQLDDSSVRPLFLAAVKFRLDDVGRTLAEQVEEVRAALLGEAGAVAAYDTRLLHAGYSSAAADRYLRRFANGSIRLLSVDVDFPRLVRGQVDPVIRKARYELDLDLIGRPSIPLEAALGQLGAI